MAFLCQICGEKNALCIQKKINARWATLYLCPSCAIERGLFSPQTLRPANGQQADRCPLCGWSSEDFKKKHCLGCPECYKVFDNKIELWLDKGSTMKKTISYFGKKPHVAEKHQFYRKILTLEKWMALAIREERYEQAEILKKQINFTQEQALN